MFVERLRQSQPFELIRTSFWTGNAAWQILYVLAARWSTKGNKLGFQQQFRADPATSHGMVVAGSLAAKVNAAAVPHAATSIPTDARSRTSAAPPDRWRSRSCPIWCSPDARSSGHTPRVRSEASRLVRHSMDDLLWSPPQFWGVRASVDCSSFVLALSHRHGRDNWRSIQPWLAT